MLHSFISCHTPFVACPIPISHQLNEINCISVTFICYVLFNRFTENLYCSEYVHWIKFMYHNDLTKYVRPFLAELNKVFSFIKVVASFTKVHSHIYQDVRIVQYSGLQLFSLFTVLWKTKYLEIYRQFLCNFLGIVTVGSILASCIHLDLVTLCNALV